MIKKATWATPVKKAYQSPNPILREVPIKSKKVKKVKGAGRGRIKQYGDAGYMPSTGKGVGY
jgi:hypothetical protein